RRVLFRSQEGDSGLDEASRPIPVNCPRGPSGPDRTHRDMPEDDSSTPQDRQERRSWFERIGAMLSGEPSTREDLVELLRDTEADGLIASDTLRMMEGAIAVSDLTVGDVMIPRSQMVALSAALPMSELLREVVESGHSRFPVHGEDRDEILGILLAKDLLRGFVSEHGHPHVRELLRPAVLIPESKKLN